MKKMEENILIYLKENPNITRSNLAKKLNITRSAMLQFMEKIAFPQQKLLKKDEIVVIGGSNIDISATSYSKIKERDSNPGKVSISFGGVGRNIADNLSRLHENVRFLTIVGEDHNGKNILENCESLGISVKDAFVVPNATTPTYIAILDENKDMKVAVAATDLCERFTPELIESKRNIIENATICVVDTNIPKETLKYLSENFDTPMFLDPVSTTKSLKIKEFIGNFHTIKPNKLESQILTGIEITDTNSLIENCKYFIAQGVKNVFISLGKDGVFFSDGDIFKLVPAIETDVINTTGAGDAFMAGIAFGFVENLSLLEACKFGIICSSIAISSEKTISDDFKLENINMKLRGN